MLFRPGIDRSDSLAWRAAGRRGVIPLPPLRILFREGYLLFQRRSIRVLPLITNRKLPMLSARTSLDLAVSCVTELSSLADSVDAWNRLAADLPFRRWEWVESWWRHYRSSGMSAYVLTVRTRAGELVGVLPCYLATSPLKGRVLRFMGSGEICSDYLTLSAAPEHEQAAAESIGRWLSETAPQDWDLLEFDGVAQGEPTLQFLLNWLRSHGHRVQERQRLSAWRLQLPGDWEEYLAKVSKRRRVRIRQIVKRQLETGQVVGRIAKSAAEFERGSAIFYDLHQRRAAKAWAKKGASSPRGLRTSMERCRVASLRRDGYACIGSSWRGCRSPWTTPSSAAIPSIAISRAWTRGIAQHNRDGSIGPPRSVWPSKRGIKRSTSYAAMSRIRRPGVPSRSRCWRFESSVVGPRPCCAITSGKRKHARVYSVPPNKTCGNGSSLELLNRPSNPKQKSKRPPSTAPGTEL